MAIGSVQFWKAIYWCVAGAIAFTYVFITMQGYPLAETDSQWFLPPAISAKNGDGLYNRIHIQSFRYDEKHLRRFVWYTPGFPRTLAALMWEPSALCAFTVIAGMNAISLLIAAWMLQKLFEKQGGKFEGRACGWCVLGLLAVSTYLVNGRIGRPDYLATLLAMFMAWVALHPRLGIWREILNAVFLAWLGFTHPVAGLFGFSILGMAYMLLPCDRAIAKLTVTGAVGTALFVFFMQVFGSFGIVENVKGILFHAKITMVDEVRCPGFIKYWIIHTYATGYGMLFMGAVVVAIVWICRHKISAAKRAGAFLFLGLFMFFTYRFVAISWDRTYNLWVFSPIYVAVFLIPFAEGWFNGTLEKILRYVSAAMLVGFSVGYLHTMAIFPYYLSCDKKYDRAYNRIQFLYDYCPGKIAVTKSLWPLVDPSEYSRTLTFSPKDLKIYEESAEVDWIVMQERYYFNHRPPELEGYELVKDDFSSRPLKLLGIIPLIPSSPAYHWAVYRHVSAEMKISTPKKTE